MGGCASSPEEPPTFSTIEEHKKHATTCEPIFFPDNAMPCREFLRGTKCGRRNCSYAHEQTSLVRVLEVLRGAQRTLDICVFTITCNEIADAVEQVARRGIAVRIITDDEQSKSTGSDVMRLSRVDGIHVRHDGNARSHMHHKFALVDGATLLNGSFVRTAQASTLRSTRTSQDPHAQTLAPCRWTCVQNWTRAAVLSNRENVVITTHAPALMQSFGQEFEAMWAAYAPNTSMPTSHE